jgi:hypothetical protein
LLKLDILCTEIWTQYLPGHWPSWHWGRCPCFHIMIVMVNIYYRFIWPWVKSLLLKLNYCKKDQILLFMSMFLSGRCISWDAERMCMNSCITMPCNEKAKRVTWGCVPDQCVPDPISHPLTKFPRMICPAAGVGSVMSGFVKETVSWGE